MDHSPEPQPQDLYSPPTATETAPASEGRDDGELTWLPPGGFVGLGAAVRELLRSYGWHAWRTEMQRARREGNGTDLLSPMAIFAFRLRAREKITFEGHAKILLLLLATPFIAEAIEGFLLSVGVGADFDPALRSMLEGFRPIYSVLPFFAAGAYLFIIATTSHRVPYAMHSHELIRMTQMRALSMSYGCWSYFAINMVPRFMLFLPFVTARHLVYGSSLENDMAWLGLLAVLIVYASSTPVLVLPDAGAKDEMGNPRKTPTGPAAGFRALLPFGIMFMNPGVLMHLPSLWHFSIPLLPVLYTMLFVMPAAVAYRLILTALPWKVHTENYALPLHVACLCALLGGATASLVSGWPGWLFLVPAFPMLVVIYSRTMKPPPDVVVEEEAPLSQLVPFQGHGRLWQWMGRLGYTGPLSGLLFTLVGFALFASLGLAAEGVNLWLGRSPWQDMGLKVLPGGLETVLLVLACLWNALIFPIAVMRLVSPGEIPYPGSNANTYINMATIALGIVLAVLCLKATGVTTPEVPQFLQFLPMTGVICWFAAGTRPDPVWLGSATAIFTILTALQMSAAMESLRVKERAARLLKRREAEIG